MSPTTGWRPMSVGVAVQSNNAAGDVSLVLTERDVTVAEVFAALDLPENTSVDGSLIAAPAEIHAAEVLVSGSLLDARARAVEVATPDAAEMPLVEVAVVGGLDAGPTTQLGEGLFRLRGVGAAPSHDWMLHIDHRDLAAQSAEPWHVHGARIEVVEGEGFAVSLGRPVDPEPRQGRTVHRPPRTLPPASVQPVPLDNPPQAVREPSPLSWATLLAPIPIAIMMALVFRPLFALFAAMGPVMALGRWYESRRRFRKDTAARAIAVAAQIAAVSAAALDQSEEFVRLRWLSNPHVGELWRRARSNSVRLWERRPGTPGFLVFSVCIVPDLVAAVTSGQKPDSEVHAELEQPLELRAVPHTVDLAVHAGVGLHGRRNEALAVARSIILQLATLHGPADLKIGVLCDDTASADWDWIKWLPHCDRRLTAHSAPPIAKALSAGARDNTYIGSRPSQGSTTDLADVVRLVIVDDSSADVAALSRAAQGAKDGLRIVAVAHESASLPAVCSALVAVEGSVVESYVPESGKGNSVGVSIGISLSTATSWARSLAGFSDPEDTDFGATETHATRLLHLVGYSSPAEIERGWSMRSADASPIAMIGSCVDGPFGIDLLEDGPHLLIAGTTGSGKSELLRTMVASLAVACPPEHLNFVLVDFKGGGAFDAVAGLPHVAGVITDLDEAMVTRAVNSLRAELIRREMLFRDLEASTYNDAVVRATEPLARLLVIVDEFAALATDYPELMAAIVDLAARGRSLGMHLVLATQRPNGIIDQKIRANTNLRIALRVQDAYDSQDVVGVGDAALIDRRTPGRALFRVAGEPPVIGQTAYSGNPDVRATRCAVRAHTLFNNEGSARAESPDDAEESAPTELDVLVEAISTANAARQFSARPLWSEPLPLTLDWIDLGGRELAAESAAACDGPARAGVALGLADLPEQQTQMPWRWDPDSGPLAIYAASASCAGKVLTSVGAALVSASVEDAHLYVIDGGTGGTERLGDLAYTGAYIPVDEIDRVDRAIRLFEQTFARRRSDRSGSDEPRLVLLIDNIAAVLAAHDELRAGALVDRPSALARDGSSQRLHLAITGRTVRDIAHRLSQQIPNRLVLALSDPSGYLSLGIKARQMAPLPAMRAIDVVTHQQVQLVEPPSLDTWAEQSGTEGARAVVAIRGFPRSVGTGHLPVASCNDEVLTIPIGIDAHDLVPAALVLRPGDHALVVAGHGGGRTTALETIAKQVEQGALGLDLVQIATPHRSTATDEIVGSVATTPDEISAIGDHARQTLVIVDDAHLLSADATSALTQLLDVANVRVIAATTPEAARSIRAWTTPIRNGGIGLVLGGTEADGDLFRVRFGRLSGLGTVPGRGHLVQRGQVAALQVAATNAPTENHWLL